MGVVLAVGTISALLAGSVIAVAALHGPSRLGGLPAATADSTERPVAQAQLDQLLTEASAARDSLQFPVGESRTTKHVQDSTTQENYDEVDELDSQGHVISLTMFSNGQLRAAMRFDAAPHPALPIGQVAATETAEKAASGLGLVAVPPTLTYPDVSSGGWVAQWDRTENGVAVRGDGTVVRVWADGRIAGVSHSFHVLAAPPSVIIDAGSATQEVNASLDQIVGSQRADLTVQAPVLEWVRPNGAFDSTRPIAEDPVCRLAWVVDVSGGPSDSFTLLTVFVDAGDGTILGGDVVE